MTNLRIIPVIDILNSEAVHAIKGKRAQYKPLESKLFNSSNPLEIVKILNRKFNFNEIYIADLDSIINNKPNFKLLSKILKIPRLKIILDPGIKNRDDLLIYSKYSINKLILGLETIDSYNVVNEGLKIIGKNELIVSIDMVKGEIISKVKEIKNQSVINVVNTLDEYGVKEIILLDLFRVGQKIGGIPPFYLKIRKTFSGNTLVGGGIKNFNDLLIYNKNEFSGVLIATAFYDGSINIEKIRKIN